VLIVGSSPEGGLTSRARLREFVTGRSGQKTLTAQSGCDFVAKTIVERRLLPAELLA
jgi:hypothetical protein